MSRTVRRKPASSVESLESRQLLAAFGTPWPDARNLTVSFPADGVDVGRYENDIHNTLDSVATTDQWQELALRAYQTWAVHADVNVGLRNDFDTDFGVPGLSVGDPRFGEFRIGAFPQESLLANSIPFQAVAGTYSGDLLINSNQQFKFHDWANNVGPDPATLSENERDLFSLILHETGNTLGISDNTNDWSVMFGQYDGPKGVLSADDIASIQELYGERSDPYELVDNGQLQAATLIPTPVGLDTSVDVIRTRGSLVAGTDVDFYKIVPGVGLDQATIRLQASGVSLLQSRLEIVDAAGQVLNEATALSVFENDNTLQISGLHNHAAIYLRVSALDANDIYSIGDYELVVDYRAASVQATDPVPGGHDSGADAVFTNFALQDDEAGVNDMFATPQVIDAGAAALGDRFELHSSVSSASDVDFLKFTAPAEINGRLVVHVSGVGVDHPELNVRILDSAGKGVGTAGRLRPDGTWTLEVAQPQAGEEYVLRVSVDPSSAVAVGNYVAVAEFVTPSDQMNHLTAGEVSDTADEFARWTAGETKLFRFDLSTSGATATQGVRLTIYDAHTLEAVAVLLSQSDVTRSTLAWLQQGDYILRFTAITTLDQPVTGIAYSLVTDGISDDQDDDDFDTYASDDPYQYYASGLDPSYEYYYSGYSYEYGGGQYEYDDYVEYYYYYDEPT